MSGRGAKALGVLLIVMAVGLVVAVLAAVEAINLPGHLRTTLGLAEETPDPPCRHGLYRDDPKSPPAPPGRWRSEPAAPKAPVEGSATAVGPVVYSMGGSSPGNLHRVLAYDTEGRGWSEPTSLPTGLNHSPAVTHGNDIYLPGGYIEGAEATSNFWRYDPRTNRWTRLAPLHQPRGAAVAAVIGDKLYVADGAPQTYGIGNPGGPYKSLEIYDFKTNSWSSGPDAPFALHHSAAAALGGKLYMAGGRPDPESSSDAFFRYDPATEKWEVLPKLPTGPISSVGLVAAAGRIILIGGDDELDWKDGGGSVSPMAWAFDPKASRWMRLPDLAIERHAFGAAVASGRIYAIGGSYCPGIKPGGPVATHTAESLPLSALNRR
jgi:N-acetylneuraminic acid mutarotase